MPTFQSIATSDVSTSSPDLIEQIVSALGKRFDEKQKHTRDLAISINNRLQVLSKGKNVDHSYSTGTFYPSSSATPNSASQYLYGMPPNYFVGQPPLPRLALLRMAEPIRPVQLTGQTGVMVASSATSTLIVPISSSAGPGRTNELVNFDSARIRCPSWADSGRCA